MSRERRGAKPDQNTTKQNSTKNMWQQQYKGYDYFQMKNFGGSFPCVLLLSAVFKLLAARLCAFA